MTGNASNDLDLQYAVRRSPTFARPLVHRLGRHIAGGSERNLTARFLNRDVDRRLLWLFHGDGV